MALQRRHLLAALGAAATPWARAQSPGPGPLFAARPALAPIAARPDRIIDIAVCTRPFRAQGPRLEAERRGRQTIIHNYGHGGSGWSLSWGSARLAVALALATRERRLAVVGCGAIGLTTARVAQRAGLQVRIYCSERPPEVRSLAATGVWSPESRVCTEAHATPAFRQRWEAMTRQSFKVYQGLLGLAGTPVEWRDGYVLSDTPFGERLPPMPETAAEPEYPDLEAAVSDLHPRSVPLTREQHPFGPAHARRYTQLVFNLPAYTQWLLDGFFREGGVIEQRHFEHPREFARLTERTLVNATGWGARALFGDDGLVPVRGQTARLVPQPEVDYGITWRGQNLWVVTRRDGILVQAQAAGDYGSADITPDRAASEAAVRRLASIYA